MADIPQPRSYSEIVGAAVDALLSRLGLPSLKVGSPALSIIEAAAQSDLRSSQDIFNLLNSLSLDRAEGQALDRIGADEQVARIGQTPATGKLTIGDSTFTKISTRVYQGGGAPIVGTVALQIEDALAFPATGSVYIGRGTTNYEGPIPYTAKTSFGSYWTLTLTGGTTKFHNLGETVVLAQGGSRTIPVGTLARTPQGNAGSAVQFATSFQASIPDGETEVQNVPAIARVPGTVGKAVINSITEFVAAPFAGATVNNPFPFSNGLDTEDDQSYRERIRAARQSRTKGTSLAIQTGVVGLTALDENNRVLSASVVSRQDEPVSLYLDDGTGYEEKTQGIAYEIIAEAGVGGEQYFNLANGRPVAKAFLKTSLQSPFALVANAKLAVEVGGVRTVHTFADSEFRSIGNASAFEIAASINANPGLGWNARLADGGTRVSIFAKSDINEEIQVVAPDPGLVDANDFLGLPVQIARSLWLYKDDRLLNKDGTLAVLETKPQSGWSSIVSGDQLLIEVDGIALTITFNDADFVNAGTQYVNVSQNNSLASWVTVLNYKIPGITAVVDGAGISITSNSDRSSRAHLKIVGGVVGAAMFNETEAQGSDQDYTMDRNLGQIKLKSALLANERLTAGSLATRGFLETAAFATRTIAAEATSVGGQSGAELWFVVDGKAAIVKTAVGPGTTITVTNPFSTAWGKRVRYNSNTASDLFGNALPGDWLIGTDLALNIANRGAYRIVAKDAGGTWVEVEQATAWAATQGATALATGGIKVVRTDIIPQRVFVTSGANYTALSLANTIQPQLKGAAATVYRTKRLRVRSNSFTGGDIALVAANTEGLALGLPVSDAVTSGVSHLADLIAGHPETGTPTFAAYTVTATASTTSVDYGSGTTPSSGDILVGSRTLPDINGRRWGNDNHTTPIEVRSGTVLSLRNPVIKQWLLDQRFYMASGYALTARDQIGITVDGDDVEKRYVINAFRRVRPTTGTYGITNTFKDVDNSLSSLAVAFGTGFIWNDFAVHMRARAKANGILWRYYRHGPEGNRARVGYGYPSTPSTPVGLTVDSRATNFTDIRVTLATDTQRTLANIRNTTQLGVTALSGPDADSLYQYLYVLHLPVSAGVREIRLNYTGGGGARTGTVTGGTSGATATTLSDPGGYVVVSGVAGTFTPGEALSWGGGGTGTASSSQYGYTTLTLTLPATTPAVADHGLQVNDNVWLQSTDPNFSTGPKILAARTASTLSYVDSAVTTAAIAGTLRISKDTGGEVTLSGSSAVAGDLWAIGSGTGLPTQAVQTIKTITLGNDRVTGKSPNVLATSTTLTWYPLNDANSLKIFPLKASDNSTANIIATVGAVPNTPITGFEYSAGTITAATYEAPPDGLGASGAGPWYALTDGINWVRSHNTPALPSNDFTFTFKDGVTAGLATASDWAEEDVRLVPVTASNVVGYLSVAAVGGLFSAAEIVAAQQASEPQITTITAGSAGSVQATGGGGNASTAAVVGNAVVAGTTLVAAVPTSESDSLQGWVSLDNTVVAPKAIVSSSTVLSTMTTAGEVLWTGTKAWKYSQDVADTLSTNRNWQIEKQGDFVAYTFADIAGVPTGFASVQEGDWVVIDPHVVDSAYASIGGMNTLNRGVYRIVRVNNTTRTFWIQNPRAVEEIATVSLMFLDYDSVLPGDALVINTSLWGNNNLGSWKVARIDTSNQFRFYVDVTTRTPALTGPTAALGASSGLVQVYEGALGRLIKYIVGIAPNGSLTDVKFDTILGARGISASYGTVIRALDKLAFGVEADGSSAPIIPGIDGYTHYTGLIAEANRTVYGDESQSSTYPGIAAAGANININGPLVRRVQVSLALRVKTGISTLDIQDKVQSAVAAAINQTGVGTPVAISKLVSAAQTVNGVVAVTVLSPVYGTGNDIISIQPFEKPLVVDIEQDVQVSFVGE